MKQAFEQNKKIVEVRKQKNMPQLYAPKAKRCSIRKYRYFAEDITYTPQRAYATGACFERRVAARCNSIAFGICAAFVAVYVASSALQLNNATEARSSSSSSDIRCRNCRCSCSCSCSCSRRCSVAVKLCH